MVAVSITHRNNKARMRAWSRDVRQACTFKMVPLSGQKIHKEQEGFSALCQNGEVVRGVQLYESLEK